MSDDWLDTAPRQDLLPTSAPSAPPIELPTTYPERVALVEDCWSRLSLPQKTFLTALREHRFNARAANRAVNGVNSTNGSHTKWMHEKDYSTIVKVWRAGYAEDALNRDRLLARQDDIVETALTPKPVFWQGVPIGEDIDLSVAARANEVLMRSAGMFPKEGADVGVSVQLPTINVELTTRKKETIEATAVEVDPTVPS